MVTNSKYRVKVAASVIAILVAGNANAQSDVKAAAPAVVENTAATSSAAELAKKLSNPVAALISVPFQFNYDNNIGPVEGGDRWTINVQPVIPFSINDKWNLISRTILPIVSQDEIYPGAGSQSGIGDTVQSLFFSPKEPTSKGWIWAVGPVFLLPTGSNDLLTADKWGVGPTALALKQENGYTYGILFNHIWSVAGDDARADISNTFLQPFFSYTTPKRTTYSINTESTYDWEAEQWTVPVNFSVSQLVIIGKAPVSFSAGLKYFAQSPDSAPHGWGYRFSVTLLFPK